MEGLFPRVVQEVYTVCKVGGGLGAAKGAKVMIREEQNDLLLSTV